MKVIEIEDNEPLLICTKLFQITIELFYTHHLKKFIKNNYAIELKYILQLWQFLRPIDQKTQVIKYAPNKKITPAI